MGWTSYHVDGKINKKAECDAIIISPDFEVLKSIMKGNTYYAAIKHGEDVFGAVVLTSTKKNDFYNFSYKIIEETCGPCEIDCPESILKLLTKPGNEWAEEWRKRCNERNALCKKVNALKYGEKIKTEKRTFIKTRYKKMTVWVLESEYSYAKLSWILDGRYGGIKEIGGIEV